MCNVCDEERSFVAPYVIRTTQAALQREHCLGEVFNGMPWVVPAGAARRIMRCDRPLAHRLPADPEAAQGGRLRCLHGVINIQERRQSGLRWAQGHEGIEAVPGRGHAGQAADVARRASQRAGASPGRRACRGGVGGGERGRRGSLRLSTPVRSHLAACVRRMVHRTAPLLSPESRFITASRAPYEHAGPAGAMERASRTRGSEATSITRASGGASRRRVRPGPSSWRRGAGKPTVADRLRGAGGSRRHTPPG